MSLIKNLSAKRIILHFLYWMGVVSLYTFIFGRANSNYYSAFNHMMATLPVYISATYFTNYYILPKFLLKKNYSGAVIPTIYVLLSAAFFYVIITILFSLNAEPVNIDYKLNLDKSYFDVFIRLLGIYIVIFSAAAVKLLKVSYEMQNKHRDLTEQKLNAELSLLKAQIHPHFLFNTLNNLYSLSLNKSDKTPDVILKLSDLLDYFLYKSTSDRVAIKKEILMIQNYIELEKLRLQEDFDLTFENKITNQETEIAPLMIIPFIENAFKHCNKNSTDRKFIEINLNLTMNKFNLEVTNSYNPELTNKNLSGGIGLENIKKRLNLIYQNNFSLDIKNDSDTYSVKLEINLS